MLSEDPTEPDPVVPALGEPAPQEAGSEAGEPDPGEPDPGEPDLGKPEPRRYPSTIGGAFYLAILVTSAVAIGIVMGHDWRLGIKVLGAALGAAGALRLVLSERDAGMLAVRPRLVDVVLLVGVGVTLWYLASSIPDQPA